MIITRRSEENRRGGYWPRTIETIYGNIVIRLLSVAVAALSVGACGGSAKQEAISSVVATAGAPSPTPIATVANDAWQPLRVPLRLTVPATGQPCPVTPARSVARWVGPAQGDGPVYPVGLSTPISLADGVSPDGWLRLKTVWVSDAVYKGLALVRGASLADGSLVSFELGGGVETELRLPLDGTATTAGQDVGWRNWSSYTMVRTPGCYALQVDGDGFSREVVFEVVP